MNKFEGPIRRTQLRCDMCMFYKEEYCTYNKEPQYIGSVVTPIWCPFLRTYNENIRSL